MWYMSFHMLVSYTYRAILYYYYHSSLNSDAVVVNDNEFAKLTPPLALHETLLYVDNLHSALGPFSFKSGLRFQLFSFQLFDIWR